MILQMPSRESRRGSCTTWRLHGAGGAMLVASFGPSLISYSSHASALDSVSLFFYSHSFFLFIYSRKD